jgi:putative FmdB family regulatory protein
VPIYEYECSRCHFRFDRKQNFDEEPVSICPKCEGKARRVIHAVPIHFKGSGFYSTDNRRGGAASKPIDEKPSHTEEETEKAKAAASAVSEDSENNESPSSTGN